MRYARELIYEFILKEIEKEGVIEKEKILAAIMYKFVCARRTACEYLQAVSLGSKRCEEKINQETKEVFIKWK